MIVSVVSTRRCIRRSASDLNFRMQLRTNKKQYPLCLHIPEKGRQVGPGLLHPNLLRCS